MGMRGGNGWGLERWLVVAALGCSSFPAFGDELPVAGASGKSVTLEEALKSGRDLWGEEAMRLPDGPSYEAFADRLPPLRYCMAAFRHYPIPLSAPRSAVKGRLVSNGSGINSRAENGAWPEYPCPVTFRVGKEKAIFGERLNDLNGPRYAQGYLPIVNLTYRHESAAYDEEVFASVHPGWASQGALLARLSLSQGTRGTVSALVGHEGTLQRKGNTLTDDSGAVLLVFDENWRWDEEARTLEADLSPRASATLLLFAQPLAEDVPSLTAALYEQERQKCAELWQALIDEGMCLEVPEPRVNDAWKSQVLGTFIMTKEDTLYYGIGSSYHEMQVEAECGDAVRALLLYGLDQQALSMFGPLLDYSQPGIESHDAAFKLQLLIQYYWLTRDADTLRRERARWASQVETLLKRDPDTGLLPRESYCGDINVSVHSLNSNGNGWRALRDMAAVLHEIGEPEQASKLFREAQALRRSILAAVDKSVWRDVQPPFIPNALLGQVQLPEILQIENARFEDNQEKPYDMIPATTMGGYWNVMVPYILGSEVLGVGSDYEQWILDTIHQRGGVFMGLTRLWGKSQVMEPGIMIWPASVDDIYGLRYVITLLRRDEVDRALVAFYGKLAHGVTRDTYIGAEATSLIEVDEFGRDIGYAPPCCTSNAHFLWMLRYLLVQDWDTDEDGKPDTLRLLFATPRPWLRDGETIRLERAPTAFGDISIVANSRLSKGDVEVQVEAPPNKPAHMLLRARVPAGWETVSAEVGDESLVTNANGTVDISGREGRFVVRFLVREIRR